MQLDNSVLKFPCDFPIKAMGKTSDEDLENIIMTIIRRHLPNDTRYPDVSTRVSKKNNYIAYTITINAKSKMQLDAIYQDLSDHEKILMVL